MKNACYTAIHEAGHILINKINLSYFQLKKATIYNWGLTVNGQGKEIDQILIGLNKDNLLESSEKLLKLQPFLTKHFSEPLSYSFFRNFKQIKIQELLAGRCATDVFLGKGSTTYFYSDKPSDFYQDKGDGDDSDIVRLKKLADENTLRQMFTNLKPLLLENKKLILLFSEALLLKSTITVAEIDYIYVQRELPEAMLKIKQENKTTSQIYIFAFVEKIIKIKQRDKVTKNLINFLDEMVIN